MRRPGLERLLAFIAVAAVAAVVVGVVALLAGPPDAGLPNPTADDPAPVDHAVVSRIVDGDTIVVEIGGRSERVRYVGVDAPELADDGDGRPAECGAAAATEANRALVAGRAVELERDTSDRDRFGRLLRHVWVVEAGERVLVTERLVTAGAMEARSYRPDTRYDERLDAAERVARADGAGIWGAC